MTEGEVSETAAMTPEGNVEDDGPGTSELIPPAEDAAQEVHGKPRPYPKDPKSNQPRGE